MANIRKESHNGHHDEAGAGRIRSGFDRRKNWGDSIQRMYERIDERLNDLVEHGAERGREWRGEVSEYLERYPTRALLACFGAGLLLGLLIRRGGD